MFLSLSFLLGFPAATTPVPLAVDARRFFAIVLQRCSALVIPAACCDDVVSDVSLTSCLTSCDTGEDESFVSADGVPKRSEHRHETFRSWSHRRCRTSGPDLRERWPSRLVATAAENDLTGLSCPTYRKKPLAVPGSDERTLFSTIGHHEMFFFLRGSHSFLMLILLVKIFIGRINKALSIRDAGPPCSKTSAKTFANATCRPSNAGVGLRLRERNLKKRIFSTWSVAGYLWRTTMNLHNGCRVSSSHSEGATAERISASSWLPAPYQEMPAERKAGEGWLMSHKLSWAAAS
jgi:hypothetical protein